jgi:ketosteroid isomerase-like protein
MAIERNKQIASEFFSRFSANDIEGALDTMADDATWWIAGRPASTPVAGIQSKTRIARIFYRMIEQTTDGLRMTVKGMTAEGDRVALELESYGKLKNGRIYNQEYHTLMVIRDGKISAVREYLDTQHVFEVWFKP